MNRDVICAMGNLDAIALRRLRAPAVTRSLVLGRLRKNERALRGSHELVFFCTALTGSLLYHSITDGYTVLFVLALAGAAFNAWMVRTVMPRQLTAVAGIRRVLEIEDGALFEDHARSLFRILREAR